MSTLFPLPAQNAETKRSGIRLIGPINLTLNGQGISVVIGPNGSGKTTLLRLLHGTARVTQGRVDWAVPTEQAIKEQSFVFQRPVMLRRSIMANLVYPLRVRGVPKSDAKDRAMIWAKRLGLQDFSDRFAPSLSGGEQQKLSLARALITEPTVVFLDEPCASLDARAMKDIEAILIDERAKGTQFIMSTHDMGQARRLADDVVFMLGGQVHEHSPADNFFTRPETSQAQAFLSGDIVEP